MQNQHKNSGGFSVIEALVTVFIFSMIMTVVGSVFTQMLTVQRRGLAAQRVQENVLFITELISREVRYATVTSGDTNCSTGTPTTMTVDHPVNGIVTYNAAGGIVTRKQGTLPAQAISSSDVQFTQMKFCVTGSGDDNMQTRITLPMTVEAAYGAQVQDKVTFKIQTTVSARDLTIDLQ